MLIECKKFLQLNPYDVALLNNFANGLMDLVSMKKQSQSIKKH